MNIKTHIGFLLEVTGEEIKEIILLMTVYTGFSAGLNGINILNEVLNERSTQ